MNLRVCSRFSVLALLICASHAWAQFEKRIWPTHQDIPSIEYTDTSGQSWNNHTLKGKRVVLNFWATWCASCLEEMPTLQAFQDKNRNKEVVVLTINNKETPSIIERYKNKHQFSLPVVADRQGQIAKRWGVNIFPTTIVLSSQGKPLWVIEGAVDWSTDEMSNIFKLSSE